MPIFHTCIHISWIYTHTLCMHRRILTVIVYSERCGSVSSLFTPLRTSVHFRKREKSSSFGFVCARRSCCLFRGPTWLALSYRVHWETGSGCKEAWWECMRWTAIVWPQFLSEIDWIRSNTLCTRLHKSVRKWNHGINTTTFDACWTYNTLFILASENWILYCTELIAFNLGENFHLHITWMSDTAATVDDKHEVYQWK